MSNIPKAREKLAKALPSMPSPWREEIEGALRLMYRRPPARTPAPTRKARVGAERAADIREYAAAHPDEHLQDIAARFGTNPGRVSEALHGDR